MDRVDPENGDGISESDVKEQGFWSQNVTKAHGDWILLLGCFATGLLDSAVFNVWSCFCSMLTGNTIYVGLGVSGQPLSQPLRWAKSGVAILSFMLGAFVFSRLMRRLGALSRKGLVVSLGLQAGITIVSAILSTIGIVPENAGDLPPDNWIVLLPISLLAIQAGGQCVLSRILGYPEVPSVVLTSSYCDLMMDEAVFAGPIYENDKRRRRVGSIVIMVLGAIAGGYLTKGGDVSNTLWIVAGIKLVMAGVWLVWKEDEGALRIE